ncbi:hypothetical protein HYU13_06520 [Candidatus Woesearchaeota archaeon]|nr:hypothetical protein [Candidatus Woesearchaeota archaeon]
MDDLEFALEDYLSLHPPPTAPYQDKIDWMRDKGFIDWVIAHDPHVLVSPYQECPSTTVGKIMYRDELLEYVGKKLFEAEEFEILHQLGLLEPPWVEVACKKDPGGMYLFSREDGGRRLHSAALRAIATVPEEKVLDAYITITDKTQEMAYDVRNEIICRMMPSSYLGEFIFRAAEVGDSETLKYLAEKMLDDFQDSEGGLAGLEAALNAALLCGEQRIIDRALGEVDDIREECGPLIKLIVMADGLLEKAEKGLGISLPRKVMPGGPKGSYGTVHYKGFGIPA